MSGSRTVSAEEALAHTDWVHRLARALVDDATSAEDLAQDAWVAVATRPVPEGTDLRAWWTGVLRKLSLMRARTGSRRAQREAASPAPEAGLRADELLERLQTQQVVARLVAELPAPVRLVLYLRYYEGLTATQIGEQLGVPAGTVRWRLKCGVDELRERLDRSFDGDRPRWTALVVPFLPRGGWPGRWILKGLVMKANELVWTLVSVVAVALLLGWWLWPKPFEQQASWGDSAEGTASRSPPSSATQGTTTLPSGAGLPAWLAQPQAPARRVAGRVLLDGRPVQGVHVRLEPEPLLARQGAVEQLTGADGRFDFGAQLALVHTVSAHAAGHTGAVREVDLRDPGVPADALELVLSHCTARVVGRVIDSAGGPVVRARVRRAKATGVESDGNGAFELCVPPGEAVLYVDADGYGAVRVAVLVLGRTLRDVVLTPQATIVGRVVDESGAPVPSGLVLAVPDQYLRTDSVLAGATLSGTDGRFELPVAAGNYKVMARAAGSATTAPVFVAAIVGRLSDEVVLRLISGTLVRGHVRTEGEPVAGAKVAIIGTAGGAHAYGVSQLDGSFAIQDAPRGEVVFTAAPWAVLTPKRRVLAQSVEDVELEVVAQGSFSGLVTREGKPVAGASVKVSAGLFEQETLSNGDGTYQVKGLSAGKYRVLASSEVAGGFIERSGEQLAAREDRNLDLELAFAATVSGQVVSGDGTPVPGAMVVYTSTQLRDEGRARLRCAARHLRTPALSEGGPHSWTDEQLDLPHLARRGCVRRVGDERDRG